jgi:hypothetical protein
MSLGAIFGRAIARLGRQKWGARIPGGDGRDHDSAVEPLAQELIALLSSNKPLVLDEPIRLVKKHQGPVFNVVYGNEDSGPLAQFFRDGEAVSQVASSSTESPNSGTSTVTQNITNSIGSLYRVAAIGDNGLVTLDEINADGNPTGNQIQARSF